MRIEIDKEVDAAYIYLDETSKEKASFKTIEVNNNIILDFDKEGKLIGIEILNASKNFSKETLINALSSSA